MSEMHNPAHPGEVLREYLPEGMSVTDAAKALNVTRQSLSAVLNGRTGVSAEMALRLEAALGVEAGFWLRMQVAFDLWEARQKGAVRGVRHIAA
jgi:addiction module HigA family antidote